MPRARRFRPSLAAMVGFAQMCAMGRRARHTVQGTERVRIMQGGTLRRPWRRAWRSFARKSQSDLLLDFDQREKGHADADYQHPII